MHPIENNFVSYQYTEKPVDYIAILGCGNTTNPELPATSQLFPCSLQRLVEALRIFKLHPEAQLITSGAAFDNNDSDGKHYNLVLKDLDAQITTTYSSSSTILAVKIKRGNPYSWYVVSKSNSSAQTANSATWKFYNAGEAVVSYAPFPAEVVSPAINFNVDAGAITLEWSASDVDNDIENYDVYFGEENPPAEYTTNVTETALENVSVTSGKTYYWQILTRDTSGNTSLSDVFSFNVN